MTGRIIQGIGGFYTVSSGGNEFVCKARGRFRKEKISPLVGDLVEFSPGAEGDEGSIEAILPRKNVLERPAVANLDLLLVTLACCHPQPDLLLADRLLVRARRAGMEVAVVFNKSDLGDAQAYARQYALSGLPTAMVSAATGEGRERLSSLAKDKVVGFAGQSAVGKSSLINLLCPKAQLETGDLSRIERGRHTTRRAQLLQLPEGGYLMDTPGFSLLELDTFDPEELKGLYPEFRPYEANCRFLGCNHVGEPSCAVREAAEQGLLSLERLDRYTALFAELKEKWGRRYG